MILIFLILLKKSKDEFFTPAEPEIVERLVVRPEDTKPQAEESISTFKQALLTVLEVYNFITTKLNSIY